MELHVPQDVLELGNALEKAGYEWYLVGGSVRDALMGNAPHDYDMATNATPDEMKACLSSFRYFETGIRHGTLTVLTKERSVEVTAYRIDGDYQNSRRPKKVIFTSCIDRDLARRDFTINAMAYHPNHGVLDLYDGTKDLKNGIIRAVGEPERRFREDALRILRALRFSAVLGFSIHEDTAHALRENAALLGNISAERIWSELQSILSGKDVVRVIRDYKEVFFFLMPGMLRMDGFLQKNPYHIYDVWEHTLHALSHTEPDPVLRFAVLWHDIGKPSTFTVDEEGVGHFYGHAQKSASMAHDILVRMKADNQTKAAILRLIEDHDRSFGNSEKALRRYVGHTSVLHAERLLKLQKADVWGQCPDVRQERLTALNRLEELLSRLKEESACLSLRDLAVKGRDVMSLGVPEGKKVGEALSFLYDKVLSGEWPNEREFLMDRIRKYFA